MRIKTFLADHVFIVENNSCASSSISIASQDKLAKMGSFMRGALSVEYEKKLMNMQWYTLFYYENT